MRNNYKLKDYKLVHIPKWKIRGFDYYYFTFDKKLFNSRTNRFSKKVVRGYSVGFNLNGKFYTLDKMKSKTYLIAQENNDFLTIQLYKYLKTA
jgi:hypothetical protein